MKQKHFYNPENVEALKGMVFLLIFISSVRLEAFKKYDFQKSKLKVKAKMSLFQMKGYFLIVRSQQFPC